MLGFGVFFDSDTLSYMKWVQTSYGQRDLRVTISSPYPSQYCRQETLALQFLHATHDVFTNCSIFLEMKVDSLHSLYRMGELIPW